MSLRRTVWLSQYCDQFHRQPMETWRPTIDYLILERSDEKEREEEKRWERRRVEEGNVDVGGSLSFAVRSSFESESCFVCGSDPWTAHWRSTDVCLLRSASDQCQVCLRDSMYDSVSSMFSSCPGNYLQDIPAHVVSGLLGLAVPTISDNRWLNAQQNSQGLRTAVIGESAHWCTCWE